MNKTEEILRYHEETKHHFHRLAKSLAYLDRKNQPSQRFRSGGKAEWIIFFKKRVRFDLKYLTESGLTRSFDQSFYEMVY